MPAARRRLLAVLAFALFAAGLLVSLGRGEFARHGDGWEYYLTLEAFAEHGSFDIRDEDFGVALRHLDPAEVDVGQQYFYATFPGGYRTTPDGRRYPLHFWMYPLTAYPAKMGLRACGGSELNALRVANGLLFLVGLGAILFGAGGPWWRRGLFALLACVNPVVWYLPFTGAEVFSWCFTTVGVVCLDRGRYAGASLAAGLAATQNPLLVLLAGVPVLVALRRKRWAAAGLAVLGAAVAFLPAAFYQYHFGKPGLIEDFVDTKLVSVERTASVLFDLNFGLLPYVPVLVLAVPAAVLRLAVDRDLAGVLVPLAVAGMLLGVQVQINWNSDCRGMMRYLVWVIPPLAWVVVQGLPPRWLAAGAGLSAVVGGAVLAFDPPTPGNYLEQRPLARWVLWEAPWLYSPPAEVFWERQLHSEAVALDAPPDPPPGLPIALPCAFGKTNGEVTKILVHRESAPRLLKRFVISPEYLPTLLAEAEASATPIYLHPPRRTVFAKPFTVHGALPNPGEWTWPFTGAGEDPWVWEPRRAVVGTFDTGK